jgi:hypothetical protein
MADAVVVGLGVAVRALRARGTLTRLLAAYGWFIEARLEVQPTGQVVLVAITSSPSDASAREAIMSRVSSHLGGIHVEDRPATGGPPCDSSQRRRS